MPLSEDEQRILSQIEQQLYESDPALAREVGSTTVYSHAARSLRWSVGGFLVGLVVMLSTLTVSYWIAFVGFVIMLAAALVFVQSGRDLGRAGLEQLTQNVRANGIRNVGGSVRDRFRVEDDDDASSN